MVELLVKHIGVEWELSNYPITLLQTVS